MKICVTGYKGSGKTTFLNILKKLNNNIYICDEFINEIYKKNCKGYKIILKKFGKEFVNNESVDKKKLGNLILANKEEEIKLMRYINPLIKKWIKKIPKNQLSFIELGTFIKYGQYFNKYFDKVLYIKRDNIKTNDQPHISDDLKKYEVIYDYLFLNNKGLEDLEIDAAIFINETSFYD